MKKFIKQFSIAFLALLIAMTLIACKRNKKTKEKTKEPTPVVNPTETGKGTESKDHAPVFHGVEDVTIEKGTAFLPLEGVSVTDEEDGIINLSLVSVNARSVNVNVVGEYIVTYTVYDADGNKTVAERKVTVVYTDKVKPDLYGVADTSIVVGEAFDSKKDVSAIDNIDGDITNNIEITGEVDNWTLGDYYVNYKVTDSTGNINEVNRKVTVDLGNFDFDEGLDLAFTGTNATVSGGTIFETIANYSLLKLELTLSSSSETEVKVTVSGAKGQSTSIIVKEEKTYTLYFRFTSPLDNAKISLDKDVTVKACKYAFAKSGDKLAPVISGAPVGDIYLPLGCTADFAKSQILLGVTAEDNIDLNVTSLLDVDFTGVDFNEAGNVKAKIFVSDTFGNKAETEVSLVLARSRDTHVILDPTFDGNNESEQIKIAKNAGGVVDGEFKDGMYVFTITSVSSGGWASGDSPYLSGITTNQLNAEQYYMFQMDVKADVARKMQIRAGLELWSDPWMENFRDVAKYQIETDWTTITYIFYVPQATSSDGSNVVKFEIHLGAIDYSEGANVIYFDNMQFYLLSNESYAPVVSSVDGVKTTFAVGQELPDFTTYVTATDVEDGIVTITADMIDTSKVDMSKPGTYEIVFNVKDSDEEVTVFKMNITVLATADTTGPVITIPQAVKDIINGLLPAKEGADLSSAFDQILPQISIVDDVDGNIIATMDMVNLNGFNPKSANTGEFEIKISCKDSSGNDSNVETFVITVIDGTAPNIVGVRNLTLFPGQVINPLDGVVGYDTTDKVIKLTLDNTSGFDAFLDNTGKVIGAAGNYQVGYTIKDKAGNETTKTAVVTILDEEIEFNSYKKIDLLATETKVSGGDSKITYENGIGTISYAGPVGWYASAVQWKFYGVVLQPDTTYKLVITAKAEVPRDFVIYFVDGDLNKIPGFMNESTGNKLLVSLTDEYYQFEYIFTPTTASSNNSTFEIDLDWEAFLINANVINTITVKELAIYPEGKNQEEQKDPSIILDLDFEEGSGTGTYTNSKWTQYKLNGETWEALSSNQMNSRVKVDKVVNIVGGWNQVRRFIYNENGDSIGNAKKISLQIGNYYDPYEPFDLKVGLISSDGTITYIIGSREEYASIAAGSALVDYEFDVDCEVKSIFFEIFSSKNLNQYCYLDNIIIRSSGEPLPDTTAPKIEGLKSAYTFPVNMPSDQLIANLKLGVKATDDKDGDLTSAISFDITKVVLGTEGEYKVTLSVKDAAGNEATKQTTITIATVRATDIILDPEFNNSSNSQISINTYEGKSTQEIKDGMYVLTQTAPGAWDSADSPYIAGLNTSILKAGNWYLFKMDIKADISRNIKLRVGGELYADPWIEDYTAQYYYNVTNEFTTLYYVFYVDKEVSAASSSNIKFEIHTGYITWGEQATTFYIDNMQFYRLSNVSNKPVISVVSDKQTTFDKGADLPDFTSYITATDVEDGNITITTSMVDTSKVNMNAAGKYDVTFTVTDKDGEIATQVIQITVLEVADTTGPVIEVASVALSAVSSMMPVAAGSDISESLKDLLKYTTITDNVDGTITPTEEMVNFGNLNPSKCAVGEYTVKISCKDSSGNDSNVIEIKVTVVDKTAPTLVGVHDLTVYVGKTYNILSGVCGYDNVDGIISLTTENLLGANQIFDNTGKVTGEEGSYTMFYKIKDAAGNETSKDCIVTIMSEEPEFNNYKKIDFLGFKSNVVGGTTTTSYDANNVLTIGYPGAVGWYASAVQLKYYNVALTAGVTYKLVIEAYAELPREFVIYFVDGDLVKIPGFVNATYNNKYMVGLTNTSSVYEIYFTPTTASSASSVLEFDFDWEANLLNSAVANTIVFKQLYIVPVGEDETPEDLGEKLLTIDFEDGAGTGTYSNANWTQYKKDGENWTTFSGSQMNTRTKQTKVVNIVAYGNQPRKFIYNEGGSALGISDKMTIQIGNYYNPKKDIYLKIVLVDTDGDVHYVMESNTEYATIPAGDNLVDYTFEFSAIEVQSIIFYIESSLTTNENQYCYLDNIVLYKAN